jgi:hypothetical protein
MSTDVFYEDGALTIAEMKEFASFSASTQRYIRRSLDVAFHRDEALPTWARDMGEAASIESQMKAYAVVPKIKSKIPDDIVFGDTSEFMGLLMSLTCYDLNQDRLRAFGPYRFLYERLFGAGIRGWLPAAFCGAAALPSIHPTRRRGLLQSISEAAATAPGWSSREPTFVPKWVDKVDSPLT